MQWLRFHMEELHELDVTVESDGAHRIDDEDVRELLFQTVRELLFNVRKHAGVSQATVRLSEETGHLVIHVVDQGQGFDVDEAAARNAQKGGFGLFSAAERLDLMGGQLKVRSAPGKGTHMEVHAPAASDEDPSESDGDWGGASMSDEEQRMMAIKPPSETTSSTVRVLTIDNHPVLREMLVALLGQEEDMEVCGEARSGAEALQMVASGRPDIALVDIALPDMSGIELVRRLQAEHPDVACVMLSVHGEVQWVEDALEAGAQGYVLKGDATAIPAAIRDVRQGATHISDALRERSRSR
jgi:CheY-like chemotaxis protein/anti-sigma regulatory factor (Ser/Thr protein kinase)